MEKVKTKEIPVMIGEWKNAAKNENSYFAEFILEYFAFNSLLRITFAPNERLTDKTLIARFKGWVKCRNLMFEYEKDKNILQELMRITGERPLKNSTRNENVRINDESDWDNIIEAVYVIRNNLFHGHKRYSRERDEKLVKVGYELLSGFNSALSDTLKIGIDRRLGGRKND